jgi:hypothetical protein
MKLKSSPSPTPVMTTETARFRFVVRFAGLDLDACRPGDLLNLKWDLRDFLSPTHADLKPGGLHTWPSEPPQPEEYSREDFRALHAEVRDLLARVIASRANPQAWTPTWVRIGLMNPHVPALPQARPGRHLVSVQGATRDLCILRIVHMLQQVNTSLLNRCPECDTIFLRKSNQTYCSKRCVNRVTQRRHRQRHDTVAIAEPPLLPTTQRAQ